MGYKRKLFNDKTVLVAAAAGVVAVSAILGTTLLSTNKKDNKGQSIDLPSSHDHLLPDDRTIPDEWIRHIRQPPIGYHQHVHIAIRGT